MVQESNHSDWRPQASWTVLRKRAEMLRLIRKYFFDQNVLEVETPILSSAAATDPHIESFITTYEGPGLANKRPMYLHSSPEFPMKRLLAAGSGAIYQVCKVFRDGECGDKHNPEFTMIEWYRPGFDLVKMMNDVEQLVARLLGESRMVFERLSYAEVFSRHLDFNPHTAGLDVLRNATSQAGINTVEGLHDDDRNGYLDLLLTHIIEPKLGCDVPCFVYDYPASQAALAQLRPGGGGRDIAVAERFELYMNGCELANGYFELRDSDELSKRIQQDHASRQKISAKDVPADSHFLAAMSHGLPACSGVALGFDRLVMLAVGAQVLDEVLAFPFARA